MRWRCPKMPIKKHRLNFGTSNVYFFRCTSIFQMNNNNITIKILWWSERGMPVVKGKKKMWMKRWLRRPTGTAMMSILMGGCSDCWYIKMHLQQHLWLSSRESPAALKIYDCFPSAPSFGLFSRSACWLVVLMMYFRDWCTPRLWHH